VVFDELLDARRLRGREGCGRALEEKTSAKKGSERASDVTCLEMRTGSILALNSSGAIIASCRSKVGDMNMAATGIMPWQARKEGRRLGGAVEDDMFMQPLW
jgi:hypothetical protein